MTARHPNNPQPRLATIAARDKVGGTRKSRRYRMYRRSIGVVTILGLIFALGAVTASAASKTVTIRIKGMS